jgi:hypothetical protein
MVEISPVSFFRKVLQLFKLSNKLYFDLLTNINLARRCRLLCKYLIKTAKKENEVGILVTIKNI